jgi:myo-inositol-1(or 4)-monophosphatase
LPDDPAYLATAIEGALRAGRIHLEYFRRGTAVRKKGPIDLVTAADTAAEEGFRRLVAARFPSHRVLGEEQAEGGPRGGGGGYRWIVDPLDGTTNFAHGLALFGVSIALEVDGRVELGVVFDPVGEELFVAERGRGAWLNGRRMAVSPTESLIDALLCTGFPYAIRESRGGEVRIFGAFLGQARAVRRLGSAALDLCYVAAGRFDGFWEDRLQPWDLAAGALIAAEAGAKVTDFAEAQVDLFRGQIVASNGRLHGQMLEVIGAESP